MAPNEVFPEHILPIFEKMKAGLFVSVGSERGFLYAGLTDKIQSLLLVDYDQSIVKFNKLNIRLLKAARNRKDYIYLRTKAGEKEWMERGLLSVDWSWWRENVKFTGLNYNPNVDFYMHKSKNELGFFRKTNYLFVDEQFNRVKQLADRDLILVTHLDISNKLSSEMLSNALIEWPHEISAIDLSNTWEDMYASMTGVEQFVKSLRPRTLANAILVLTEDRSSGLGVWLYNGFYVDDFLSSQSKSISYPWFNSLDWDELLLKHQYGYLFVPDALEKKVLDGDFGSEHSNLVSLLSSDKESQKLLALSILAKPDLVHLTENSRSTKLVVENVLNLVSPRGGDKWATEETNINKTVFRVLSNWVRSIPWIGVEIINYIGAWPDKSFLKDRLAYDLSDFSVEDLDATHRRIYKDYIYDFIEHEKPVWKFNSLIFTLKRIETDTSRFYNALEKLAQRIESTVLNHDTRPLLVNIRELLKSNATSVIRNSE